MFFNGLYMQIALAIRRVKERAKVVIITDYATANNGQFYICWLQGEGIEVRYSPRVMHTKFCLIDNRLLLTGTNASALSGDVIVVY